MTKNKLEKMDKVTKESVMKALDSMEPGRQSVKNKVSPVVVHKEVREMSWDAFRATGLLTFINGFLHIFGWAICAEYKDGKLIRAYPMRTPWRGFKEETWIKAYGKIADYMAENADKIKDETKNGNVVGGIYPFKRNVTFTTIDEVKPVHVNIGPIEKVDE